MRICIQRFQTDFTRDYWYSISHEKRKWKSIVKRPWSELHPLKKKRLSLSLKKRFKSLIIQSHTGHKSTDGLRAYERVTDIQHEKVSNILSGSLDKFNSDGQCSSESHSGSRNLSEPKTPYANQYNNCMFYSPPSYPYCQLPQYYPMSMPFYPEIGNEVFPVPSFPPDFNKN